jgi:hypothetical protein
MKNVQKYGLQTYKRQIPVAVLRRGFAVLIPPEAWISVRCECCVLSGRCLYVGLTTRPEDSYRVLRVWVLSRSLDNEEALAH